MRLKNVTKEWLSVPLGTGATVSLGPNDCVIVLESQAATSELSRLIREKKLAPRPVPHVATNPAIRSLPGDHPGESNIEQPSDGTRVPGDPPFDVESVVESGDGPGPDHDAPVVIGDSDIPDLG